MPKDQRSRSISLERHCRGHPYPLGSSSRQRRSINSAEISTAGQACGEWEDVRCPVCMEHPHNAVMLSCSSHNNGCRPFMCNTSYRHSNCLDQYLKSSSPKPERRDEFQESAKLTCPLCRGTVTGWTKQEDARNYMNQKARSCSRESCNFVGVYRDLRKHARKEHPTVRPSEVDPERQRDWYRMEQQRDLGDLFSMFRSGMDVDEDLPLAGGDDIELSSPARMFPFPLFTVLLVIQSGSTQSVIGYARRSSRDSARSRRGGRSMILWGEAISEPETIIPVPNSDDADSEEAATAEAATTPQDGEASADS